MANEFKPRNGVILSSETASRALTTDANSKVVSSSVTSTELGYVSGVTSAIQTQINTKAPSSSPTLTTPSTDIVTLDGQSATPSSPSAGFYKMYMKDATQKLTILDPAGVETSVGSGTGASNYITASDGTTIGDWLEYDDGASSTPVDGYEATPSSTSSFAVQTSSAMNGTTNFLFTHTAANNQGEGFSYLMAIDPADRGRVLRLTFDYKVGSGTYADNDLTVWFYDNTNGALIQGAPYQIKNSSLIESFYSEVQVPSSCASLRVIFHVATSTATAYTMLFDNFVFGRQQKSYGSPITDVGNTWPVTTSLTTNATILSTQSRVGDKLFVSGRILFSGANTQSGEATISLPSTISIDTSKMAASTRSGIGSWTYRVAASGGQFTGGLTWNGSASTVALTLVQGSSNTPTTIAVNDTISFDFWVPISGWSSSLQLSDSADTREVSGRWTHPGGQAVTTGNTNVITTLTSNYDSHSGMNTTSGVYTVPVPGRYKIRGMATSTSQAWTVGTNAYAQIRITGTKTVIVDTRQIWASVTNYVALIGETTQTYNAGDTISISITNQTGSTFTTLASVADNWVTIERISGPSQIAASETVSVKYTSTSTSAVPAIGTVFDFSSKTQDTHGSVTTGASWKFTAPISGTYSVSADIGFTGSASASRYDIELYKNGSRVNRTFLTSTGAYINSSQLNTTIQLLAGEYIDIRHGESVDGGTYTSDPHSITIIRVGNY